MNIIFDSGSQRRYITDDLRKRLKLPVIIKEKIVIKNFGNIDSKFYNAYIVPVQFAVGQQVIVIECVCSPFICSDLTNQSTKFIAKNYPHLKGLFLVDTSPDGNKKIEVLKGAANYYRFISGNLIRGFPDQQVAVESVFGWVISGFFDIENHSQVNINHTHLLRVNTETNPYYDDTFKGERMRDENEILKCAVVYVRVVCSHGIEVNLWAGKCRVAPMKDLSIPLLELLACVLLSKSVVSVINAVRLEVH